MGIPDTFELITIPLFLISFMLLLIICTIKDLADAWREGDEDVRIASIDEDKSDAV